MLVEPGKARPWISGQRGLKGELFGILPATTPRWVPKKVLCVLPGDDVRAFLEGGLERPVKAEDVGHVEHQDGPLLPAADDVGHEPDGLPVEEHALAEDDELGLAGFQDPGQPVEVGLVGIVLADREIDHLLFARRRVFLDEIEQRAHGLGAEVPAVDELVIEDQAHPAGGLPLGPAAVEELDQALEDDLISHLAADRPELDVGASEIGRELFLALELDVADEIGPLVKIDLVPFHRPVLGVTAGRVGDLAHLDQERGRRLRRDEVEAFLLAPGAVPLGPGGQGLGSFDEG